MSSLMVRFLGPIALPSMNVYACLGETFIFSFPGFESCANAATVRRNVPPRMPQNVLNTRCLIDPPPARERATVINYSDHTGRGVTATLAKLTDNPNGTRSRPECTDFAEISIG